MALGAYNGFPGRYRESQYALLKAMWAAGDLAPPSRCAACFQTHGAIHAHNEDYSQPDVYDELCITCHLALHVRFRRKAFWVTYRRAVAGGWQPLSAPQQAGVTVLAGLRALDASDWTGSVVNDPRAATLLDKYPLEPWIHPNARRFSA